MALYDAEHKAETRRRIIETASERFKQDGIDGSGIATLVSDARPDQRRVYAHFQSKNDLVANVLADQLRSQRDALSSLPPGREALEEFVRDYLAPHHRDQPGTGCPNAALLDEIGRCDDTVRDSYTQGMQSLVEVIVTHLSPHDPSAARIRALWLFTILVATLQLARAVSDRKLCDDILASGIGTAQMSSNGEQHPSAARPGRSVQCAAVTNPRHVHWPCRHFPPTHRDHPSPAQDPRRPRPRRTPPRPRGSGIRAPLGEGRSRAEGLALGSTDQGVD